MMQNDELDERLRQDLAVLNAGVSEDALRVLEDRYGFNSTIFSDDAVSSDLPNDVYLRQALIREGQRQVLLFIRFALNKK